MTESTPADRLEYLRQELRAERISYGELAELQALAEHIDPGDVELLEAAGVPEFPSRYDMALIITVDAKSYDEAQKIAEDIAAGLGDAEQIACSAALFYERDNEGQRVLKLHSENAPSDN